MNNKYFKFIALPLVLLFTAGLLIYYALWVTRNIIEAFIIFGVAIVFLVCMILSLPYHKNKGNKDLK